MAFALYVKNTYLFSSSERRSEYMWVKIKGEKYSTNKMVRVYHRLQRMKVWMRHFKKVTKFISVMRLS